jgi:Fe-S oxidoreductase
MLVLKKLKPKEQKNPKKATNHDNCNLKNGQFWNL